MTPVTLQGAGRAGRVAGASQASAESFLQQLEGMGPLGYLGVGIAAKQRFNATLTALNVIQARNDTAKKIIASIADPR